GGAELPFSNMDFRYDDTDLYSTVVIPRQAGVGATATSTSAAITYGPRTLTRPTSLVDSAAEVNDAANYLLYRYQTPGLRIDSVTLPGEFNTPNATWVQLLTRTTHFDRITIKRRPPGGGTITQDSNIEGLS